MAPWSTISSKALHIIKDTSHEPILNLQTLREVLSIALLGRSNTMTTVVPPGLLFNKLMRPAVSVLRWVKIAILSIWATLILLLIYLIEILKIRRIRSPDNKRQWLWKHGLNTDVDWVCSVIGICTLMNVYEHIQQNICPLACVAAGVSLPWLLRDPP